MLGDGSVQKPTRLFAYVVEFNLRGEWDGLMRAIRSEAHVDKVLLVPDSHDIDHVVPGYGSVS